MDNLGKKIGKSESKNIYKDIEFMFAQISEEIELQSSNIENKINSLFEEAKSTLKKGDKYGAKRILREKKNYEEVKKSIGETLQLLEEQINIYNTSNKNEEIINIIKQANKQIKEKNNILINKEELILQSIKDKENKLEDFESKAKELLEVVRSYLIEGNKSELKRKLAERKNIEDNIKQLEGEIKEFNKGMIE